MAEDFLFVLIIAGAVLSIAYIRAELRDARRHRHSGQHRPN
jgi:hypothetical protein